MFTTKFQEVLNALQTHTKIRYLHQKAHCLRKNTGFLWSKVCADGNRFAMGTFRDLAPVTPRTQLGCCSPSPLHTARGSAHCSRGAPARVYSSICPSAPPQHAALRVSENSCMKCWVPGILICSGCISTEELWMATNCPYYANETARLETAYVALLKMRELLVCKVQFNKPSLLKTFKPQNTASLLLISHSA